MVTALLPARTGLKVLVLEQSAKLRGSSRTEELVPGYRFNTHSAEHNIINASTSQPQPCPGTDPAAD